MLRKLNDARSKNLIWLTFFEFFEPLFEPLLSFGTFAPLFEPLLRNRLANR
jgi:hypothetical protein